MLKKITMKDEDCVADIDSNDLHHFFPRTRIQIQM